MSKDDLDGASYELRGEHVYAVDDGNLQPREYFIISALAPGSESGVVVVARSPTQMLDLRFICYGYSWNPRRPRELRREKSKGESGRLVVEFPPQHLAEEIFADTSSPQPGPVAARVSATTRLVFSVPHEKNLLVSLSREPRCLLDWDNLVPQIHPRAMSSIGVNVRSQLKAAFGDPPYDHIDFAKAQCEIQKQFADPGAAVTTLEIAGRLLLSPNEKAGWVLGNLLPSPPGKTSTPYPLWSATLDEVGRKSVRALWSRRFQGQSIPNTEQPIDDDSGPNDKALLSLSPRAHWQIVGQTALYGLPAMRRLQANGKGDFDDAPTGSVIRPKESVGYLNVAFPNVAVEDAGIAIAKPFAQADIQLTALGATVYAEWKGEPARLLPLPPEPHRPIHPWSGFSLERLQLKTWLGRDVQIVELYKGFLYPLGVRAAYAVVRERRIKLVNNIPVSFVVQRQFIMTPGLPRRYPGPYHPHDARDFPANTVRMKTLITPDLLDPAQSPPLGEVGASVDAFWPQYGKAGAGQDVFFEWLTDDGVLVVSRLFFVSNETVSNAGRLADLLEAYNEPSNERAVAELAGARKRYAEPSPATTSKAGEKTAAEDSQVDTSFDTFAWRLGVYAKAGPNPYTMDGRMEGADQPPFYPYVKDATIGIQSLDRLLGISHGTYTVTFDEEYCRENFSGREIYLRLKTPLPTMESHSEAQKQGQTTGALVHQKVSIDAISRKIGPMGGASKLQPLSKGANQRPGFDPSHFFDDVRLFGAINLKDLIQTTLDFDTDAPKLVEDITQGLQLRADENAAQAITRINEAASEIYDRVYGSGRLYAELNKWMDSDAIGTIKARELFEPLCASLDALLAPNGLRHCLEELKRATSTAQVLAQVGILSLVQPVVREVERRIEDPVPDLLSLILEQVLKLKSLIEDARDSGLDALKQTFKPGVAKWLKAAFCHLPVDFIESLFGGPRSCTELEDPIAVFCDVNDAMLREVMSRPLQEALDKVLLASGALEERLKVLPGIAAKVVHLKEVTDAVGIVAPYLDALDPGELQDIRHLAQREELTRAIAAAVSRLVRKPLDQLGTVDAALKTLQALQTSIANDLPAELKTVFNDLATLLPTPDVAAREQAHRILVDALESRVQRHVVAGVAGLLGQLISALKALAELKPHPSTYVRLLWRSLLDAVIQNLDAGKVGKLLAKLHAEWSRAANGITDGLSAGVPGAKNILDQIAARAKTLASDPQCTPDHARLFRGLAGEANSLSEYLNGFTTPAPTLDVFVDPGAALREVRRYQALRQECGAAIHRMADHLRGLERAYANQVQAWAVNCGEICSTLLGLTSWDAFQNNALKPLIVELLKEGQEYEEYVQELRALQAELDVAIPALARILQDPGITLAKLLIALVDTDRILRRLDALLAARVMQAVAFSAPLVGDLEARAAGFLRLLASQEDSGEILIELPHNALIATFDAIAAAFSSGTLAAVLKAMTELSPKDFTTQSALLIKERKLLRDLAGDPQDCIDAARKLSTKAKADGLQFSRSVEFIQEIRISDLAQHVTNAIAPYLKQMVEELREIADVFAPTKIVTKYEWKANLASGKSFGLKRPEDKPHLSLLTTITFDPLALTTDVVTTGTLKSFYLMLIDGWEMATLTFDGAKFEMHGGHKPKLTMNVESVELGQNLQYLALLQSYLSGSSDNFYYRPTVADGKVGVEAGYMFDAGLIQIGSVQFINVTFGVGMRLFFDSSPAEFFFKLADKDRPFLIACPPYGGGGWLTVTSEGEDVTGLELTFVFGGVTALEFSVLKFQARVLMGVGVRFQTVARKKQWRIQAIFEAVGEGNIACFSVSVFIRITLEQVDGGDLWGHAVYGFSFRVGFVKISYRVTASYRLAGSNSKKVTTATNLAATGPQVISVIEDKVKEWDRYVDNFSMELLAS